MAARAGPGIRVAGSGVSGASAPRVSGAGKPSRGPRRGAAEGPRLKKGDRGPNPVEASFQASNAVAEEEVEGDGGGLPSLVVGGGIGRRTGARATGTLRGPVGAGGAPSGAPMGDLWSAFADGVGDDKVYQSMASHTMTAEEIVDAAAAAISTAVSGAGSAHSSRGSAGEARGPSRSDLMAAGTGLDSAIEAHASPIRRPGDLIRVGDPAMILSGLSTGADTRAMVAAQRHVDAGGAWHGNASEPPVPPPGRAWGTPTKGADTGVSGDSGFPSAGVAKPVHTSPMGMMMSGYSVDADLAKATTAQVALAAATAEFGATAGAGPSPSDRRSLSKRRVQSNFRVTPMGNVSLGQHAATLSAGGIKTHTVVQASPIAGKSKPTRERVRNRRQGPAVTGVAVDASSDRGDSQLALQATAYAAVGCKTAARGTISEYDVADDKAAVPSPDMGGRSRSRRGSGSKPGNAKFRPKDIVSPGELTAPPPDAATGFPEKEEEPHSVRGAGGATRGGAVSRARTTHTSGLEVGLLAAGPGVYDGGLDTFAKSWDRASASPAGAQSVPFGASQGVAGRARRVPNSLTFPKVLTDGHASTLLADWLCGNWLLGMGDDSQGYSSVSTFVRIKLAEIESLANENAKPNKLRAAAAFVLLDVLIDNLGSVSDALHPIRTDLLQCTYTRSSLEASAIKTSYDRLRPDTSGLVAKMDARTYLRELLTLQTHFDRVVEVERLREEDAQAMAELDARRVARARERAMREAAYAKQAAMTKARIFYGWRAMINDAKHLQAMDALREALKHVPDEEEANRLAQEEEERLLKSKALHSWYRAAMKQRLHGRDARIAELEQSERLLQDALHNEELAHARSRDALRLAREGLDKQGVDLEGEQQKVSQLQELLRAASDTIALSGRVALQAMRSSLTEVQLTPDAGALAEMLTATDLDPNHGHVAYTYGGDGSGEAEAPTGDELAAEARDLVGGEQQARSIIRALSGLDGPDSDPDLDETGEEAPAGGAGADSSFKTKHTHQSSVRFAEAASGEEDAGGGWATSPRAHTPGELVATASPSSPRAKSVAALSRADTSRSLASTTSGTRMKTRKKVGKKKSGHKRAATSLGDLESPPSEGDKESRRQRYLKGLSIVKSMRLGPKKRKGAAADRQGEAATRIQHAARGRLETKNMSAVTIQRVARGCSARNLVGSLREQEGAVKMQAMVRGRCARNRVKFLRAEAAMPTELQEMRTSAAEEVQRIARGRASRMRVRAELERRAATSVQRIVRGRRARFRVKLIRAERRYQEIVHPADSTFSAEEVVSYWAARRDDPDRLRALETIGSIPVDVLLLRWTNYHCSRAWVNGFAFPKRVANFSGDFQDGEALAGLLSQVSPSDTTHKAIHAPDPFHRAELVVDELRAIRPTAAPFAEVEHIASGDPAIIAAIVGRLFSTHGGLVPPTRQLYSVDRAVMEAERHWSLLLGALAALGADSVKVMAGVHALNTSSRGAELRHSSHGVFEGTSVTRGAGVDAPYRRTFGCGHMANAERKKRGWEEWASPSARDMANTDELMTGVSMVVDTSIVDPAVAASLPIPELVDRLRRFGESMENASRVLTDATAVARVGHRLWHDVQGRVNEFLWEMWNSKIMGKSAQPADEREARALEEYTVLPPAKYKDLLDKHSTSREEALEQIEEMQEVLRDHRAALAKIFQYYCASGTGKSISTMHSDDYWAFLKDVQLATKGHGDVKSARLDLIFRKAKQKIGLPDEEQGNPDKELIPRQFVETIIRTGALLFEERAPADADPPMYGMRRAQALGKALKSAKYRLADMLMYVLTRHVVPHGVMSNTEEFREELTSEEVRAVFKKHRVQLQKVFAYYASSAVGTSLIMMLEDFLRMLRDAQLLDVRLTPLYVRYIFGHTQVEEAFMEDTAAGGGEDAMVYSEFIEGIAAIALDKMTSPYVSVSKRIDKFLSEYLLPKAKTGKRKDRMKHRRSNSKMKSTAEDGDVSGVDEAGDVSGAEGAGATSRRSPARAQSGAFFDGVGGNRPATGTGSERPPTGAGAERPRTEFDASRPIGSADVVGARPVGTADLDSALVEPDAFVRPGSAASVMSAAFALLSPAESPHDSGPTSAHGRRDSRESSASMVSPASAGKHDEADGPRGRSRQSESNSVKARKQRRKSSITTRSRAGSRASHSSPVPGTRANEGV